MSGNSNVIYYLSAHGQPGTAEAVRAVLHAAKHSTNVLTLEEVGEIVRSGTGSEREQAPTGRVRG
jgi:hypothetical protein